MTQLLSCSAQPAKALPQELDIPKGGSSALFWDFQPEIQLCPQTLGVLWEEPQGEGQEGVSVPKPPLLRCL